MSKIYKIEKSPLYRMRNRRKLAVLLGLPQNYFSNKREYKYCEFSKPKPNGDGERHFTVPSEELKLIQKALCRLLTRIETPDWVMSGKKHCSYITNAERHVKNQFVKTMDISRFYDSVQKKYIYKMFKDTFRMAEDIAWLMTDLVTYKGILPTGSPSSQLIVYWTYCDMFAEINRIANNKGCIFTLYVDDMTFSSQVPISIELRKVIAEQLRRNNLKAKVSKDHYYQANKLKVITGVGIKNGEKVVLNKKRQAILQQFRKCKKDKNIYDIERLNGMLCSQRQIESDIFPEIANFIKHYEAELKTLARNRFYRNRRKRTEVRKTIEKV
ncbi:reverse transcriptase family protein [Mediterraneibacter gnavus]|uniref:reverse transcriptase family protein n=1 Tax=Mediterraneibacter gnavus TaxID=33038 RepID=UPI0035650C22